ncbi:MAG TPA: hypothetical protein VLB27_06530, partial [candidate division Zixibacteria bacterium]|nr:hypothetical protein [candidate division Zixibacteria bacterium]
EAGKDNFFKLFAEKLDAMINPTFTDEEIRREVCNMGLVEDKENDRLWLEEKGTVYNEMVSSFERPWGNLYRTALQQLYGPAHPLSYSAGGLPSAIREMGPEDIRAFHGSTHHLNNMGSVVSIGDEIPLGECLTRLSEILSHVEPTAQTGDDPADLYHRLPPANPAPDGDITLTYFPHQNENEPGMMAFTFPAVREDLTANELYTLGLFFDLLAQGQTSNLYRKFIDSQTRVKDIGANSVGYWIDDQPGQPIFLFLSNVNAESCTADEVAAVRELVMQEIRMISEWPDGSPELAAFNERAANQVTSDRRSMRNFLNSPPRFGYRGSGSNWIDHLQRLDRKGGDRRNLANVAELAKTEELIAGGKNFWRDYITTWKLLERPPFGAATSADPAVLATEEAERETRIQKYVDGLKAQYAVATDEEAVQAYKAAYDENTKVIQEATASITMPSFVDNPPLSLDDNLNYTVDPLPGGGQLVTSTFDNMTSGTVGLVFDLTVVPEADLLYVPALPTVLRDIGVIRDGEPLTYDEFDEILRKEILSLRVYFDANDRTERTELALRGAGSDRAETEKALQWLNTALFNPDLRPENLPRIRDAIDLEVKSARNRMRGSEESWVNTPVYAFWKQHNPALLSTQCFLTQAHSLHRLRWLLRDGGPQTATVTAFLDDIAEFALTADRDALEAEFTALLEGTAGAHKLPEHETANALARDAVMDLRQSLSDVPDASLASDIGYLCQQMSDDLATAPQETLNKINNILTLLRRQDNARAFIVANGETGAALKSQLTAIVGKLDKTASQHQTYSTTPVITTRVKERGGLAAGPTFVALVNNNTRAGVHIHTADCASYETTNEETLLKFLAARLYGGGGAHSMFMKTWGAGLAYSNGLRSSEARGRLIYYAERCPDLAQTLEFVVNELKNAPYDESLAEYAVAQAFVGNRSGARYEERGEQMAADLADGLTADVVAAFRKGILKLRQDPELYAKLHERMTDTYGAVLPGLGPQAQQACAQSNAIYFVIGPEKQLESWEEYLSSVEPAAKLTRMYPRDYWLISGATMN